jgi:hypothetical protein
MTKFYRMRLLLAVATLFGVIGCFCMLANAQGGSSHSHRDHTVLTLSPPITDSSAVDQSQAPSVPIPAPPRMSAVLFARSPEVLRNLARLAIIAVQFWRT